jgi:hypothetical protein
MFTMRQRDLTMPSRREHQDRITAATPPEARR